MHINNHIFRNRSFIVAVAILSCFYCALENPSLHLCVNSKRYKCLLIYTICSWLLLVFGLAFSKSFNGIFLIPLPPATSLRPKNAAKVTKHDEDDDLWDSIAAPAPKTSKPLNVRRAASADDDLWNAIAAPAPATRAQPLSSGRGRGAKPAAPRLGAQRKNHPS